MEAVLKCNKGFSTPTKAGTLALPKGIDFLLKALQNGKKKTPVSHSKIYHKSVIFLLKVSKSRAENSDCSPSWFYSENLSCGICQGNWKWRHRRNFPAST